MHEFWMKLNGSERKPQWLNPTWGKEHVRLLHRPRHNCQNWTPKTFDSHREKEKKTTITHDIHDESDECDPDGQIKEPTMYQQ